MFSPELVAWELIRHPKTVWVCSLQNFHANFLDPPQPPRKPLPASSHAATPPHAALGAPMAGRPKKACWGSEAYWAAAEGSWRIMRKWSAENFRQLFFHGKCWFDHVQLRKNMKNTHIVWNDDLMKRWFHQGREWIRKPWLSIGGGLPQNSDKPLFEMVPHVNIPALD